MSKDPREGLAALLLMSVSAARAAVLAAARPLGAEDVSPAQAAGRVLAAAVVADASLPPFDASEMDGYAVRFDDVCEAAEAAPRALRVVGDVAAGDIPRAGLEPGVACRIMTGAPLPAGADAVVPREWTDDGRARVLCRRAPAERWAFVRRAGSDFARGEAVLAAGVRLTGARVACAVAAGAAVLSVGRRPRVALVATGDELSEPGTPLRAGAIRESNRYVLRALCAREGAQVVDLGLCPDDPARLEAVLDRAVAEADVVITTGGVSQGDHDYVRPALSRRGEVLVHGVAVKPGKPLVVVRAEARGSSPADAGAAPVLLLGLPGNPAAVLASAELFCAPLLRALQGAREVGPCTLTARLEAPASAPPGREAWLRASMRGEGGELRVRPGPRQASGSVRALAEADALVCLPRDAGRLEAGALVEVLPLDGWLA